MGFITLGICVAAAATLDGTLQTVAIVVAVANGLSLLSMMGSRDGNAEITLNFVTAAAGVGLLAAGLMT